MKKSLAIAFIAVTLFAAFWKDGHRMKTIAMPEQYEVNYILAKGSELPELYNKYRKQSFKISIQRESGTEVKLNDAIPNELYCLSYFTAEHSQPEKKELWKVL